VLGAVRPSLRQSLPAESGQRPASLLRPVGQEPAEDPRSFEALYRAHAPGVYHAAYRVLGRQSEAEDVTQDVFVRFWRDPSRFDPSRGELGAYLRLIARSRALDLWRQEQAAGRARDRLKVVASEDEGRDARPAAVAERDEQRAAVRAALRTLPASQREALVLSYWGSLSSSEIAARAGVPFGTARSRIRLGIEKLRRECAATLAVEPNPPTEAGKAPAAR
jgi:RNA polymerase sigma-70 factor (ECF subfamily)